MIRKILLAALIFVFTADLCISQDFKITAEGLFKRPDGSGQLNINQNPAIDSLLNRYILSNRKIRTYEGTQGMHGFRIQIYYNSIRTAREESARAQAEFINKFPDIQSYAQYQEPGWFIIRAGDYRTKTECYRDLLRVRKEFQDAYPVPTVINFPDLIRK